MIKGFEQYINEGRRVIPDENKNGDCFVQALTYFQKNYGSNHNLRLCHGLVTGQGAIKGIVYNHAWCEDIVKEEIHDMTMPEAFQHVPTALYYYFGKIKEENVFKYDGNQVLEKVDQFETYGPWEDKLLKNKY